MIVSGRDPNKPPLDCVRKSRMLSRVSALMVEGIEPLNTFELRQRLVSAVNVVRTVGMLPDSTLEWRSKFLVQAHVGDGLTTSHQALHLLTGRTTEIKAACSL